MRAKVNSVRVDRVEMLSSRTFGVRGARFLASYSYLDSATTIEPVVTFFWALLETSPWIFFANA